MTTFLAGKGGLTKIKGTGTPLNVTASPSPGSAALIGRLPTVTAAAGFTGASIAGTIRIAGNAPAASAGRTAAPSVGVVRLAGLAPIVEALQFWAGSLRLAQAPADGGTFSTTAISQAASAGLSIAGIRHNALMAVPPTAGPWSWSAYDAQWAAMQSSGLKLYLTLFDGAGGASAYPGDDANSTIAATERTNWAAQALDVSQYLETNYPGLLVAIEIWNEPDGAWPIPADKYVLLAAAVKTAIRSDVELSHIPITGPTTVTAPGAYWQTLIDNGVVNHLDWIAIHTYSAPHHIPLRFDALLEKLAQVNAEGLPVVISEWGGEGVATSYEIASGLTIMAANHARVGSYFTLRDYPTFPSQGLITSAGAAKDHSAAWIAWHSNVGDGATYVGRDTDLPFTIECHRFTVAGSAVRVVWASSGTPQISIAGTYTAKNVAGTSISAGATQVLGPSPIYLLGTVTVSLTAGQDVLLAGNNEQFSGEQGRDGWSYHVLYAATGLYDSPTAPHYDAIDNRWELAGEANFAISTTGMHPEQTGGNVIRPVRRWTVLAGISRVKVSGTWARSSSSGDGSDVALWHNNTVRFRRSALREGAGGSQESPATINQIFNVVPGDFLEFRVGPGPATDINFDNTTVDALIYSTTDAVTTIDDDQVPGFVPSSIPDSVIWSWSNGGKTLVNDGTDDRLSQWDDETTDVLDVNFVQNTVANRPYWLTTQINGLPAVDFRQGQFLVSSINASGIWAPNVDEDFEIAILFKLDAYINTRRIFAMTRSGTTAEWLINQSTTNIQVGYRVTADTFSSVAIGNPAAGTWNLVRLIKDGASLNVHLNGNVTNQFTDARIKVFNTGQGSVPIGLGADGTGASLIDGKIADFFVSKTILTTQERADHNQWYEDTFGIVIA